MVVFDRRKTGPVPPDRVEFSRAGRARPDRSDSRWFSRGGSHRTGRSARLCARVLPRHESHDPGGRARCDRPTATRIWGRMSGRKARRLRWVALAASLQVAASLGCKQDSARVGAANGVQMYPARGVVREVPADAESLVIAHEKIEGFMPAMTMKLRVRDPAEKRNLLPGDAITFQLFSSAETHWIANIARVGQASVPPPAAHVLDRAELNVGDAMPDHELLSEDGHTIRLSDYRGQALAFTFIFTRCPISDYCPRMSKNLALAHKRLSEAPGVDNWQLLSISFDPDYDRPEVLKAYAEAYREGANNNWTFAAASADTLRKLAPQVDLMLKREAGGGIGHNLRTVVLDPQGRIHRQFDGNEWTGEDLAQAMLEASQGPSTPRP
ncbi:MAG: redoxin domain-containing protein [Myxococcales bacterium FL481]|nr:MAG: redoxin domain-containing protein [Myxococcales bacterium FL481]